MKFIKETKFVTIVADTAEDFDRRMNAAIKKHDIKKIEDVQIEHGRKDFRAYILATTEKEVPEDIKEIKELAGESLFCKDCPYYEEKKNMDGSPDKRAKFADCSWKDSITPKDSTACVYRYKEVFEGKPMPKIIYR